MKNLMFMFIFVFICLSTLGASAEEANIVRAKIDLSHSSVFFESTKFAERLAEANRMMVIFIRASMREDVTKDKNLAEVEKSNLIKDINKLIFNSSFRFDEEHDGTTTNLMVRVYGATEGIEDSRKYFMVSFMARSNGSMIGEITLPALSEITREVFVHRNL